MTASRVQTTLRWSALLTAAGLALMLWSIFEPRALPVVLAMSVGQGLGTLAFGLFGWVVISDVRTARRLAASSAKTAATEAAAAATANPTASQDRDERS